MEKIKKVIIGTNNAGKYKEIFQLLPKDVEKISPDQLNIEGPEETGKTFEENSIIKAVYFSNKANLICLSDDSGLEIDLLNGEPGIYSARWGGKKKNFNLAIKKVFSEMQKKKSDWQNNNKARFVCCMTLYWPGGKSFSSKGIIKGKILKEKKGDKGFGYDPIFVPNGYSETFAQMKPELKMSIDHRSQAFAKLKNFFI
mgnify:CR=1 FL=1